MDVQMPEMDGFAATRAIREKEEGTQRHIPIIAATAYALTGDRERCMAAGMDAYVSKPIRGAALLEMIANVIAANPNAQQAAEPTPKGPNSEDAFDLDTALEYVEGEREVLRNMVAIYLKNSPRLQNEIREAIANGDSDALMRAAHRLRGSMSMLAATAACAPAQTLEEMAEKGDLTEAAAVHAVLEREVIRLEEALVRFSSEVAA
jgi:CheY-like chemotaxis protein